MKDSLTRIANYLMMNASFQDDLGIFQGKMGCVLFFAHYSRYISQQGDTGDILADLNEKIMERNPLRIQDLSFEKGLAGIAYYVRTHVQSPCAQTRTIDAEYLQSLETALKTKLPAWSDPRDALKLPDVLSQKMNFLNITDDARLSAYPLGIAGGLAGMGLKMMGI